MGAVGVEGTSRPSGLIHLRETVDRQMTGEKDTKDSVTNREDHVDVNEMVSKVRVPTSLALSLCDDVDPCMNVSWASVRKVKQNQNRRRWWWRSIFVQFCSSESPCQLLSQMEMREEIRRVTCPHWSQYEGEMKGEKEIIEKNESRESSEREGDNFIWEGQERMKRVRQNGL